MALRTSGAGGRNWSRFGPTLPTALTARSVWHVAQFLANSLRPLTWALDRSTPPTAWLDLWSLPWAASTSAGRPSPKTTQIAAMTIAIVRRDVRVSPPQGPPGPRWRRLPRNATKKTPRPAMTQKARMTQMNMAAGTLPADAAGWRADRPVGRRPGAEPGP